MLLDFDSVLSGKPVPIVHSDDMKRVWMRTFDSAGISKNTSDCLGWDVRVIDRECTTGSDAVSVFCRVALLKLLIDCGLLAEWSDGGHPQDVVFNALATYDLSEGVQRFRPEEFLGTLNRT